MTRLLTPAIAAAIALPTALTASPALAQTSMPGMEMPPKPAADQPPPAKPVAPVATAPAQPASDPHAGHTMPDAPSTPEQPTDMPGMEMSGTESGDHDMSAMQPDGAAVGSAPAPAPPSDHAADALFDPAEMARSRADLRRENGAFSGSMILFDLAEFQARPGGDGYRWKATLGSAAISIACKSRPRAKALSASRSRISRFRRFTRARFRRSGMPISGCGTT